MKLIIAGGRKIDVSVDFIKDTLVQMTGTDHFPWGWKVEEVVSGRAKGVDTSGERFAKACNISIKEFPADWDNNGKAAGPIRNVEMGEYADAALIIWDGMSSGSRHMRKNMLDRGKPVYEVILRSCP